MVGSEYVYSDLSMITSVDRHASALAQCDPALAAFRPSSPPTNRLAYVIGGLARDFGHVSSENLREECARTLATEPRMCYFEA